MTEDEKVKLIDSLENIEELEDSHFEILRKLSLDGDEYIRSCCAALLINFENDESKLLLLQLAKDEDSFVRTEAYDSLGVFIDSDVANFLHSVITIELDGLARSYAILSWIDIVYMMSDNYDKEITFLKKIERSDNNSHCLLNCCYGLYLFGENGYLDKILSFLKHKNYQIRCSVLNLLKDIDDADNKEKIINSINIILISETSKAVISTAKEVLNKMF